MRRYTFSIVITVLLVAAFLLCVILFQRETDSDSESILIYQNPVHEETLCVSMCHLLGR